MCVGVQDRAAFLAGERAALGRAFRESLPSQQALGALCNGVAQVSARMAEEAAAVRQLQAGSADMGATMRARPEACHAHPRVLGFYSTTCESYPSPHGLLWAIHSLPSHGLLLRVAAEPSSIVITFPSPRVVAFAGKLAGCFAGNLAGVRKEGWGLQGVRERLENLEAVRLPQLEARVADASAGRPSDDLLESLHGCLGPCYPSSLSDADLHRGTSRKAERSVLDIDAE